MHPVPVLLDHITPINRYKVADLVAVISEDSGQVLSSGRSSYRGTIAMFALDPADRMHWILDERTHSRTPNNETPARLVRVDLFTLDHEVVWEGPRYGNFDKHWLSVDHDGQVLLTGSSEQTGIHVMVRIESDAHELGSTKAVAMQFGQGSLPTQTACRP